MVFFRILQGGVDLPSSLFRPDVTCFHGGVDVCTPDVFSLVMSMFEANASLKLEGLFGSCGSTTTQGSSIEGIRLMGSTCTNASIRLSTLAHVFGQNRNYGERTVMHRRIHVYTIFF